MSKRDSGPQFDFGAREHAPERPAPFAKVVPFVDAATMQVRRDAMRRFAATGIFASRREGKD